MHDAVVKDRMAAPALGKGVGGNGRAVDVKRCVGCKDNPRVHDFELTHLHPRLVADFKAEAVKVHASGLLQMLDCRLGFDDEAPIPIDTELQVVRHIR